jgi:hypothetical protein
MRDFAGRGGHLPSFEFAILIRRKKMEGLQRAENPTQEYPKVSSERRSKGIKSTGAPHFAPSAKFQLILQVFLTEVCKGFASKCPGGQKSVYGPDTLIEFR